MAENEVFKLIEFNVIGRQCQTSTDYKPRPLLQLPLVPGRALLNGSRGPGRLLARYEAPPSLLTPA